MTLLMLVCSCVHVVWQAASKRQPSPWLFSQCHTVCWQPKQPNAAAAVRTLISLRRLRIHLSTQCDEHTTNNNLLPDPDQKPLPSMHVNPAKTPLVLQRGGGHHVLYDTRNCKHRRHCVWQSSPV